MDNVAKYKAADQQHRRKLRGYSRVTDPTDLTSELAVGRLMLADAIEAKQTALANMVLGTLAKLSHSQLAVKRASSEFIERAELRRLGERLSKVIFTAFQGRFPGWQEAVDRVAAELTATVEEPCKVEEPHE